MKYYIISGEASGDLHGSNLIKSIKEKDSQTEFRVWGGDLMQEQGAELVRHYRDLAFMGFVEVAANLSTILSNISFCKKDIAAFAPDVVIMVDYPGFNLQIAKWCKKQAIRTFYYISPQVWAWKEGRVKQIKANVDRMFVILPFEKDFFAKHQYSVDYVGHPLLDALSTRKPADPQGFRVKHGLDSRPVIALLPGSRKQEIKYMLGTMSRMVERFPQYQFVVAGAPSQAAEFYSSALRASGIKVIFGCTYDILSIAHSALVTSGTATLETALIGVPQVVCYKGSFISYSIGKHLIKVKYISLVNLIADRRVVTELIQSDFTPETLAAELSRLDNPKVREQMLQDYSELRHILGDGGASQNTARLILEYLKETVSRQQKIV